MTFVNIPNPDGSRKPCGRCGQPTVLVNTGSGTERQHCGTYTARCHTTTTRGRATR